MACPNREILIHKCIFTEQSKKVKEAITYILQKDSLSASDTKAIRLLTEVYDALVNSVQENYEHHQADCNNGRFEESQ